MNYSQIVSASQSILKELVANPHCAAQHSLEKEVLIYPKNNASAPKIEAIIVRSDDIPQFHFDSGTQLDVMFFEDRTGKLYTSLTHNYTYTEG